MLYFWKQTNKQTMCGIETVFASKLKHKQIYTAQNSNLSSFY